MRKNITLVALAMAASSVVFAQQPQLSMGKVQAPSRKVTSLEMPALPTAFKAESSTYLPMNEVPKDGGRVVEYSRFDQCYEPLTDGTTLIITDDGWCNQFVFFDEEKTVYINAMVGNRYLHRAYVKGDIQENGDIVIQLPQCIENETGLERDAVYLNRFVAKTYAAGFYYAPIDNQEDNKLVLHLQEDGTSYKEDVTNYVSAEEIPEYITGIMLLNASTQAMEWGGYGDWVQEFTVFTEETLQVPEDLETEEFAMTYGDAGSRIMPFGIKDNFMYIGNWTPDFPNSWVKGEITADEDNDLVRILSDQFIGKSNLYNHYLYLVATINEPIYDTAEQRWLPNYMKLSQADLPWDPVNKKMFYENELVINWGKVNVESIDRYAQPKFTYIDPNRVIGNPQNPKWARPVEYSEEMGCGMWFYYVYPMDIEGNILNSLKMYYNIWVDGEEYPLRKDEYYGLTEDILNIPFDFTNEYDIFVNGTFHQMPYYMLDYEYAELQSTYVDKDNVERKSDRVKMIHTGGVTEFVVNELVSEIYYDLNGRLVSNPTQGIYVKKEVYKDGKVVTCKVVKR